MFVTSLLFCTADYIRKRQRNRNRR